MVLNGEKAPWRECEHLRELAADTGTWVPQTQGTEFFPQPERSWKNHLRQESSMPDASLDCGLERPRAENLTQPQWILPYGNCEIMNACGFRALDLCPFVT